MAYSKEQREAKKQLVAEDTAKVEAPKAGVTTQTPTPAQGVTTMTDNDFRDFKHKIFKFVASARCYIEGVQLEEGQTILLGSAAAYRQRKNGNLHIEEGVSIPVNLSADQIKDMVETDPKVGSVSKEFNLIQQGSK